MGWIRFDNGIGNHRKALDLAEEHYLPALGLFLVAVAYCDQQRTDGHLPKKALPRIAYGDYESAAEELVRVGFFHEVDGGFQINDYLEWQMSAEQIEAKSEMQRKKALARHAAERAATGTTNGTSDGNADETRQDNTSDTSDTDETRPLNSEQIEELRAVSNNRLGRDEIIVLSVEEGHPYHRLLEAIRRARKKSEQGERVRSWSKLVAGIADRLRDDGE